MDPFPAERRGQRIGVLSRNGRLASDTPPVWLMLFLLLVRGEE
jgi:hypothetical protein